MSSTLEIREARLSDLSSVMQLIAQSDMSPDTQLSTENVEELFSTIENNPAHTLFVVEDASGVIGTFALIIIQQLSHNGAKSAVIEDIVVKSDLQGQGVGKEIIRFAVAEAQARGCYKMILSSGNSRTQAHGFYQSLGYRVDGLRFALDLD